MNPPDSGLIASGVMAGDTTRHIRGFLDFAMKSDEHDHGVYYFAIVASACYLESVLEESSVLWCKTESGNDRGFQSRLMDKIAKDISRATGLDGWKQWMRVLYDVDLVTALGDDWPTIKVLFDLRNQLAHGRTTKFMHFWNSDGNFLGMTTSGSSYEIPFEHLIQRKVIVVGPGTMPSAEHLLTGKVARYFFDAVSRAIYALQRLPALKSLGR